MESFAIELVSYLGENNVSFCINTIEVQGCDRSLPIAAISIRVITYRNAQHKSCITVRPSTEEGSLGSPIVNFTRRQVTRAKDHVTLSDCIEKERDFLWFMRKIGIHFKNEIVSVFQCIL